MNVVLKYPTSSERSHLKLFHVPDMHTYADAILKLVYDNNVKRSLIFTSFNPSVCSILNWKQPNYGVFFGTRCGLFHQEGPWKKLLDGFKESDIRCNSIKEAVRYAKNSNFLGIVCEATPLVRFYWIGNGVQVAKSNLFLHVKRFNSLFLSKPSKRAD